VEARRVSEGAVIGRRVSEGAIGVELVLDRWTSAFDISARSSVG
jgi:hypothetical protein